MRRVVELFAGVGGFRIGLNDAKLSKNKVIENNDFNFVFYNQWEPSTYVQNAYKCYSKRFACEFNILHNSDITKINKYDIPDHDLLVAGFPCQDYSVARSLSGEKGIEGKKGVLWWEIYNTLVAKNTKFVLLENVDRLLISPSSQKGRNFAIMLKCLQQLDYYVEWKTIKASDYGMPQSRKRVFIFACKKTTNYYKLKIKPNLKEIASNLFVLSNRELDFFKNKFDYEIVHMHPSYRLDWSLEELHKFTTCTFLDSGFMSDGWIYTAKTSPIYNGNKKLLKDIIQSKEEIHTEYFIDDVKKIEKFKFLKDKKKIERNKNGYKYYYSEGKMSFPENLNKPGRTILTSEGQINRSTHIIGYENNEYRLLTPKECERLNMFPDDWTNIDGVSNKARRFLMGNALVCGIIKKLSKQLKEILDMEDIRNDS